MFAVGLMQSSDSDLKHHGMCACAPTHMCVVCVCVVCSRVCVHVCTFMIYTLINAHCLYNS